MSSLNLGALRWDKSVVRKHGIRVIGPITENRPVVPEGFRFVAIVRGLNYLFNEWFTDVPDLTHPLYYAEFFDAHQRCRKHKEFREMALFLLPEALKPRDGRERTIAA